MKAILLAILTAGSTSGFAPQSQLQNTHHSSSIIGLVKEPVFGIKSKTALQSEVADQNPFSSLLSGLFSKESSPKVEEKPKIPDCVIDPDYKLGIAFLGISAFIVGLSAVVEGGSPSLFGGFAATLHALLGALFVVQATRIRFVFDETSFELKMGGDNLEDSGENVVVGGANRWEYDTFVNYDFFPKADSVLPVLVYFKETKTPEDKWNEGPGQLDKIGGGQIHFFPVVANPMQLKEQFELRGYPKKD